jgi:hypothetical protein
VEKEFPRRPYQDDFQNIRHEKTWHQNWAKDMESSKRYLLQAEVEYWHEMLSLNKNRVPPIEQEEMRNCLKRAVRALNVSQAEEFSIAA